jgi:predicted dehydrogenase
MKRLLWAAPLLAAVTLLSQNRKLRLIEVAPGHFHAAQLHSEMLDDFSDEVHVYAPLGPELTAHLDTIGRFNSRAADPTHWSLRVFAGPDYLDEMLREPPGNVVVLSGRNGKKIDLVLAALRAGQNVLADKPWIIEAADLPKLETALELARTHGLIAYDCMTQRFDTAYQIQRELVRDPAIFGDPATGSPDAPAVRLENLHSILKSSAGAVMRRPPWFFDIHEQGEGIADVATHLVDLVEWTLFPAQTLNYRRDARVVRALRSPTKVTAAQFEQVTGERSWPSYLASSVKGGVLEYYANGEAVVTLRGVHIGLRVGWQFQAAPGQKDTYLASYQGTRAHVELRQGAAENYVAEVSVIPAPGADRSRVQAALRARLAALAPDFPGLRVEETGQKFHIVIPKEDRLPEDEQFPRLARQFTGYVRSPKTLPAYEESYMITKYYLTTAAVAMARGERQ